MPVSNAFREEVIARNEHLPRQFERASLSARFRSRPLGGKNLMTLNIHKDEFWFWPGQANLNAFPNKRNRQVVLHADEKAREITRQVSASRWTRPGEEVEQPKSSEFVALFPLTLNVSGVKHKVTDISHTSRLIKDYGSWSGGKQNFWKANVTAIVPETAQTFLMGFDETATFIAALPERVTSVKDAHEILRPKGVPEGSLRQGEWFFTPAKDSLQPAIETATVGTRFNRRRYMTVEPLDFHDSSHQAMCVKYRGKTYARGYVTDRRISHHKPLFLPIWHEVHRNTELLVNPAQPPQRLWD